MTVFLVDYRFWNGNLAEAARMFDCEVPEINEYFIEKADGKVEGERLILIADSKQVFGFISLSIDTIKITSVEKLTYPILKINAIGIDRQHQCSGYGTQLILAAFRLALNVNQVIPIDGVYLIALRDAVEFYEKFDIRNLNAPPEWVMTQQEFQMAINIAEIVSLGVEPYSNVEHLI